MPPSSSAAQRLLLCSTLTPFLYPCLDTAWTSSRIIGCATHLRQTRSTGRPTRRHQSTQHVESQLSEGKIIDVSQYDHLNPVAPDYSSQPFVDACTLSIHAGGGGHGCISFLREKFIANGPPNGGDGGTGGSIYIQAVQGETSLHKIARRGILKAGRGKNGQGSAKGGARGEDVVLTVPVGTVVREISRVDPVDEEERLYRLSRRRRRKADTEEEQEDEGSRWRRDKWLIYPGTLPRAFSSADLPAVPRPRRSNIAALQPGEPIRLDLDAPMDAPMLLAAGAMGGLGNPHFVTKALPRPKFALKGDGGMQIDLQLELKILADVGLVGLPNAGKSTLLRAITRSRTRVGNWAFTTLSPSIGTVVLDSNVGRPTIDTRGILKTPRTNFTIADIPGLIQDAHLDRGLGLGFLRHIERAAVLAFVVDLSAGDAVEALKGLWHEVGQYEKSRDLGEQQFEQSAEGKDTLPGDALAPFEGTISPLLAGDALDQHVVGATQPRNSPARSNEVALPRLRFAHISKKPWLVVATKADLPDTQDNFARLQGYLKAVQDGEVEHPSAKADAWRKVLHSVPVSAINKEGVSGLPEIILTLLDQ